MDDVFSWIEERFNDLVSLLPDSPFIGGISLPRGFWLNWLNWFVPVYELLNILVIFLILIPTVMAVQWMLRYIGVIE
jgi:hypothetical protein